MIHDIANNLAIASTTCLLHSDTLLITRVNNGQHKRPGKHNRPYILLLITKGFMFDNKNEGSYSNAVKIICDWICKKGSSTHIRFYEFNSLYRWKVMNCQSTKIGCMWKTSFCKSSHILSTYT